jgi:hypothetical protein
MKPLLLLSIIAAWHPFLSVKTFKAISSFTYGNHFAHKPENIAAMIIKEKG